MKIIINIAAAALLFATLIFYVEVAEHGEATLESAMVKP